MPDQERGGRCVEGEKELTVHEAKKIFYKDRVFFVFAEVYEPAEDTFLFADSLRVRSDDEVLDVGTGCGILAVLSALVAKRVVATDINPHAAGCAQINAKVNGVSEKVDIVCGDMFNPLRKDSRFDVVLFNAPYLPTEQNNASGWIDYAWSGGKSGRELIDRFIASVPQHLKAGGRALLVQSTLSDVERTLGRLGQRKLDARIVGECKTAFETITLIEAVTQSKK